MSVSARSDSDATLLFPLAVGRRASQQASDGIFLMDAQTEGEARRVGRAFDRLG